MADGCPGCARRVCNGGIGSEAKPVQAIDDVAHQGILTAEQVTAAGNVQPD